MIIFPTGTDTTLLVEPVEDRITTLTQRNATLEAELLAERTAKCKAERERDEALAKAAGLSGEIGSLGAHVAELKAELARLRHALIFEHVCSRCEGRGYRWNGFEWDVNFPCLECLDSSGWKVRFKATAEVLKALKAGERP